MFVGELAVPGNLRDVLECLARWHELDRHTDSLTVEVKRVAKHLPVSDTRSEALSVNYPIG